MHMQVQHMSAQTIPVTITQFSVGSQILLYGQPQTYKATLSVPANNALPTGTLNFLNASSTLTSFSLAQGTASGNTLVRCRAEPLSLTKGTL